jgi:hypothetical protein
MKSQKITDKQREYLKGCLSLWWDIPHKLIEYNDSVKRVNKILHRGTYKTGGIDEKSIKDLMECITKIT